MIVDKDGADLSPDIEVKETSSSPEKELLVAEENANEQQIQIAIEKTEIVD